MEIDIPTKKYRVQVWRIGTIMGCVPAYLKYPAGNIEYKHQEGVRGAFLSSLPLSTFRHFF